MQTINKRLLILLLGVGLVSCEKNFESINTNPNQSENIDPEYLMSSAIVSTAYDYQKEAYFDKPASAGRYITMVRNEGNDKFGWGPQSWDGYYRKLSTIKDMADIAAERSLEQYTAVAKILTAFNFAYTTDLYGDIPYSEALLSKEEEIIHPAYDRQETIYPDLLKQLAEANDLLAGTTKGIDEVTDMMYKGDVLKWRKFANSLRLRLLLRCSKHYQQAFTDMQAIVNDKAKYPIFESNDDNAEIPYLENIKDYSWPGGPMANSPDEFDKRKPSKELVDALLQRNDPRLPVWVAKVEKPDGTVDDNEYVGVPNAIPAPYDYNGGNDHISKLSKLFNSDADPMLNASLITYAEVCFIMAEAAQAGKVNVPGKSAEALYYDGIEASMAYYGVDDEADAAKYYDQPLVKYDGTLKQLITQKWLAQFLKGAEGWFDHRRTGFPQFVLGPLATQKTIPSRYIYPDSEPGLNKEQYEKALSVFGEDKQTTLMWYLK